MKRHFSQIGKSALAALLVGIVLLLDAMAACPSLHEFIHKDADQADHQCAVTMFTQGKVESVTVDVLVVAVTVFIEPAPQIEFSVFRTATVNLSHARGPPVTVSSQA